MSLRFTETGKERRALRAAVHKERPVVQIGRQGLEPAVIESAEEVLVARELIKVAVGKGAEQPVRELAEGLATELGAELVEVKGRTFVLYRPEDEEPIAEFGQEQD